MKKEAISYLLFLIFAIGFFIRVYNLDSNPPGIYRDEVIYLKQSYSLMEEKRLLPPVFPIRAFGAELSLVYIYSLMPFLKIFGVTIFGARIASVIYGSLSILCVFLLARKLFNDEIALLSSLLMAVSPISNLYSRVGWETISLFFYLPLFIYLLLKSVDNNLFLVPSFLVSVFAYYSYATSRLFIPLFVAGFIILYRKKINKKKISSFVIFFIAISAVILVHVYLAGGVNPQVYFNAPSIEKLKNSPSLSGIVEYSGKFLNFVLDYLPHFVRLYAKCFSYNFLFSSGNWNWPNLILHQMNEPSLLYPFYLPLILIGLILLALDGNLIGHLIIFWLLISPIPTAFTRPDYNDPEYARRFMSVASPLPEIVSAYALYTMLCLLRSNLILIRGSKSARVKSILLFKKIEAFLIISFVFISLSQIASFLNFKFWIEPHMVLTQKCWCYPAKEALLYAESVKEKYDNIIVTSLLDTTAFPLFDYGEHLVLFYSKFKNEKYLRCSYPTNSCYASTGKNLYILTAGEMPPDIRGVNLEKIVHYSDGTPVLYIYSQHEYLNETINPT